MKNVFPDRPLLKIVIWFSHLIAAVLLLVFFFFRLDLDILPRIIPIPWTQAIPSLRFPGSWDYRRRLLFREPDLDMLPGIVWNLQTQSIPCLLPPNTWIIGTCHHTWLNVFFLIWNKSLVVKQQSELARYNEKLNNGFPWWWLDYSGSYLL